MATFDTFRRGILPKASAEAVDALLWNCSAYPFIGDVRKIRRSIRTCLKRGGGTIGGAVDYAHSELDAAMTAYRATSKGPEPQS